jgi:hypothetical protein
LNSNKTSLNQFKIETSNNVFDYNSIKKTNYFDSVNSNITQLETDIRLLDQFSSNTFELANDYLDAEKRLKSQLNIAYTDDEIEELKIEGYIQEAVSQ